MKHIFQILLILTFVLSNAIAGNTKLISTFKFANLEKAKSLLSTEDVYISNLSQFDIDSRLQKKFSKKEELLKYAANQAEEWTEKEKELTNLVITELDSIIKLNNYHLDLPSEVYLLKTTMKEESGAVGYTRGNFIVLNSTNFKFVELDKYNSMKTIRTLLIHELFHVLTRHNREFKKNMYSIIGFRLIPELKLPKELFDIKMSNPDAPFNDSYITLKANGKPADCMMFLYTKKEYTTGSFFEYLNIGFVKLEGVMSKQIAMENGKPVIYSFQDIDNFVEQIGQNTGYAINPEEVLADNFVFAILNESKKSQWVIEKIQNLLKNS